MGLIAEVCLGYQVTLLICCIQLSCAEGQGFERLIEILISCWVDLSFNFHLVCSLLVNGHFIIHLTIWLLDALVIKIYTLVRWLLLTDFLIVTSLSHGRAASHRFFGRIEVQNVPLTSWYDLRKLPWQHQTT